MFSVVAFIGLAVGTNMLLLVVFCMSNVFGMLGADASVLRIFLINICLKSLSFKQLVFIIYIELLRRI